METNKHEHIEKSFVKPIMKHACNKEKQAHTNLKTQIENNQNITQNKT